MQYENWNFENDLVITDELLMFPKNTARKFMGTAYAVETTKGIFYQKPQEDGSCNLMHVDEAGERVFIENAIVVASDMNYTCIIVHCEDSGEFYLVDTRGIFFLLEVAMDKLGPAAYKMTLDRGTGFYDVGTDGNVRWMLRGVSKEKQFSVMMESAPSYEWTLNPKFKTLFSKKNAGKFFYLTIPSGKKGKVIEALGNQGLPYETIPNVFIEDDSRNIRISINEKTIENKALHFAMAKYYNTYNIAGIPLELFMGTLKFDRKVKNQLGVYMRSASNTQYPQVMSMAATLKMWYEAESDMDLYKKLFKRLLGLFSKKEDLGFENSFEALILPYPNSGLVGMEENIRIMREHQQYIVKDLGFTTLLEDLERLDRVGAYRLYEKIYDASKKHYKSELASFEKEILAAI